MSASAGLLNLLSNVQTLESSIASTILEMTLKLSSLTSASFFLVVETEQIRRVAGSPDLIEKFRNNSLCPSVTDSVVSLNSAASSLVECPLLQPLVVSTRDNVVPTREGGPLGAMTSIYAHSFSDYLGYSHSPSGVKRKSNAEPEGSRPKKSLSEDIKEATIVKMEPTGIECASFPSDYVDIPDSDSDIEVLGVDFGTISALPSTTHSGSSTTVAVHPRSFDFHGGSIEGTDCGDLIAQMELNLMKIESLQKIPDPTLPFQKGSIECRLISSLFYDFGKELRRLCPFDLDFGNPDHRNYFARHVDAFLGRFPNLELQDPNSAVSRLKVEVGSDKRYTPAAFLRVNARNGFKARRKVDKTARTVSLFTPAVPFSPG